MLATHKPLAALTARDIMTPNPVTIPRQMSLRAAARRLSQCRITGAPVVDDRGACIGVLSASDFMTWAEGVAKGRPGAQECICSDWQVLDAEALPGGEVEVHMTADPVTTSAAMHIGDLARMMLDAHIHRVIVVDEAARPIGIVSSTDILAAVARVGLRE